MSAEGAVEIMGIAEGAFRRLRSSWCGFSAGANSFNEGFFIRDIAKAGIFVLTAPIQPPDYFMPAIEKGIELGVRFQGRVSDPQSEEQIGDLLHEMRNGYTSKEKIADFEARGYKVHIKADSTKEVIYYGGGDTAALFIKLVTEVARFKERVLEGEGVRYIKQMRPNLLLAHEYQTRVADSSGYGLLDSVPRNLKAIFFHTEHDSDFSFTTEAGETPRPPHIFLANNCDYVASLLDMSWAAHIIGDENVAQDAKDRHAKAQKALHELFWMRSEGYYAPLLDGEGQQVKIITSDALEGLWLKTFPEPFADQVIERLKEPDMNTRFGIRSRSRLSSQFAMNGPKAYWNGNVWEQDTGKGAFGAENYGHFDFARKLDEELFRAVLLRGCEETFPVDDEGAPIDYQEYNRGWKSAANNPQLWAAAAAWTRAARYLSQAA